MSTTKFRPVRVYSVPAIYGGLRWLTWCQLCQTNLISTSQHHAAMRSAQCHVTVRHWKEYKNESP